MEYMRYRHCEERKLSLITLQMIVYLEENQLVGLMKEFRKFTKYKTQ